ncbi:hypothetical protein ACPCDX_25120 [Streptomyces koyangensis]|uniref:hypothetical protein n=1 Tax=Streptomyces koyangensis TaxID=188770 RepID=UPI003C2E32CB
MLAVVADVGEEEGAEVDLFASGQYEQGRALDAAAVGDDLHGVPVEPAGSGSRSGVGWLGVMGSRGLLQDRHMRDSMDVVCANQVFLSRLSANRDNSGVLAWGACAPEVVPGEVN